MGQPTQEAAVAAAIRVAVKLLLRPAAAVAAVREVITQLALAVMEQLTLVAVAVAGPTVLSHQITLQRAVRVVQALSLLDMQDLSVALAAQ
jgi:Zn-dependent protease